MLLAIQEFSGNGVISMSYVAKFDRESKGYRDEEE
jgi:hypothetical protein